MSRRQDVPSPRCVSPRWRHQDVLDRKNEPVHEDLYRKIEVIVYLLWSCQILVELKSREFKGENRRQMHEPLLHIHRLRLHQTWHVLIRLKMTALNPCNPSSEGSQGTCGQGCGTNRLLEYFITHISMQLQ